MACDCKVESACTAISTYCKDGTTDIENAITGQWLDFNSVQTGLLTIVGYLLYKFSQSLPALIRWPIRIFCYLTGLSGLWGWVSHLVGTLRGIERLLKWPSRIVRFVVGSCKNVKQCVAYVNKLIRRPSSDKAPETEQSPSTLSPREHGLRLILMGPPGGGRTSLADTLLGCSVTHTGGSMGTVMECTQVYDCTRRRAVVNGREVTVVDTPDLLGHSLGDSMRAREALRSLQLASPGPHAILLVLKAPGSDDRMQQDAAEATRAVLELVGEKATGHLLIVLSHAECLGQGCDLAQLLEADAGGLRTALSLCGQTAELVDNSPDSPLETRRAMGRRLLERVVEMKAFRGHYTHELQMREDRVREELLEDMASLLALKLGHM